MDPFACYFRNVQLTDNGDYKSVSRSECGNNACRICDQFFNDMKPEDGSDGEEKETEYELDEVLLDVIT